MKLVGIELKRQHKAAQYGSLLLLAAAAISLSIFYTANRSCVSAAVEPNNFCQYITVQIDNSSTLATNYAPVRVPFLGSNLQINEYMNQFGSGLELSDINLNQVNFMNQEINSSSSAGWWYVPETISAEGSALFNMYVKDTAFDSWRDNGFYFYNYFNSNELITVPDHATFNLSDNFSLYADVIISSFGARTCPMGGVDDQGWIIDRHINVSGYAIGIECDDLAVYSFGVVNGTKVRTPVTTGYNTPYSIELKYTAPDISLLIDGVELATGTAVGPGVVVGDLTLGGNLKNTWIQNAQLSKNIGTTNDIVFRYNFDGPDIIEDDGVSNPYTGIIYDVSGNSHTSTYNLDRSQSNFSLTIATPTDVGSQNFITSPSSFDPIAGPPFGDITSMGDQNSRLPFFRIFSTAADGMGIPQSMFFGGMATMLAFFAAAIVLQATRAVPMALITYGSVMVSGVVANLYPYYFALAVMMLLIGVYGSSKFLNDGF